MRQIKQLFPLLLLILVLCGTLILSLPGAPLYGILIDPEDGVVEAFVHESLPVLAVQWHPEKLCFDSLRSDAVDGEPLIQYFVNLCANQN